MDDKRKPTPSSTKMNNKLEDVYANYVKQTRAAPTEEFVYHASSRKDIPTPPPERTIHLKVIKQAVTFWKATGADETTKMITILRSLTTKDDLKAFVEVMGYTSKELEIEISFLCRDTKTMFKKVNLLQVLSDNEKAKVVATYLLDLGKPLLDSYVAVPDNLLVTVVASVTSRSAQGARAKKIGHVCEQELARVVKFALATTDYELLPLNKDNAPHATDPNVSRKTFEVVGMAESKEEETDEEGVKPSPTKKGKKGKKEETHSFDILIRKKGARVPLVCIQSLIHTSDPGKYGLSKASESTTVRDDIDRLGPGPRPLLAVMVDGVGSLVQSTFLPTLTKAADSLIQRNTLYKMVLLLHALGVCSLTGIMFDPKFYDKDGLSLMKRYVPPGVHIYHEEPKEQMRHITAGKATLYFNQLDSNNNNNNN